MSKRLEIQTAGSGSAVVETWLEGQRTAMTQPLPTVAARSLAHKMAGRGDTIIDHTTHSVDDSRARATRMMDRGEWRP